MNARCYDFVLNRLERRGMTERRRTLLENVSGSTLEIGAGTGLNFPLYPPDANVVAIEPDPSMIRRARERAREAEAAIEVFQLDAQRLPLDDNSFEHVVGTLVMCTIPRPEEALAEIGRVLRPGGSYLFLEHVRGQTPRLVKWQDRLEKPWRAVAGGCHPNRDTLSTIAGSGLDVASVDRFELGLPWTKPHVAGVALRP